MFLRRALVVGILFVALVAALGGAFFLFGSGDSGSDDRITVVDPFLAALVASPTSIVFDETGHSLQIGIAGRYSDGTERSIPDQTGAQLSFSSTDSSVVIAGSSGLATAVGVGGAYVVAEYAGLTVRIPVISVGVIAEIPLFDVDRVAEVSARPAFVVNRIIVEPVGSTYDSALASDLASDHGGIILAEWPNLGTFGLELDIDAVADLEIAVRALEVDPRIAAVHRDALYRTAHVGERSAYSSAGLDRTWPQLIRQSNLSHVHVVVVDTGISINHEIASIQRTIRDEFEFSNLKLYRPLPEIPELYDGEPVLSHGLAVASAIAGGKRVPGVIQSSTGTIPYTLHLYGAGSAKYKTLGGRSLELFDAFELSEIFNHIQPHWGLVSVVNMSLSADCYDPSGAAITGCYAAGVGGGVAQFSDWDNVVFVAAAGNDQVPLRAVADGVVLSVYPAFWANALDNVISVGALDAHADGDHDAGDALADTDRACFSNFGSAITVAAEGMNVHVLDTASSSGYSQGSGTSYSAPLVTGVVALMRAVDPSLTPLRIKEVLVDSATDVAVDSRSPGRSNCGSAPPSIWKQVNGAAALSAVLDDAVAARLPRNRFTPAVTKATDKSVDLLVQLHNTGRIAWTFTVYVGSTNPRGEPGELVASEVELPPGRSSRVRTTLKTDESGEWTLGAVVSRHALPGVSRIEDFCGPHSNSGDCLDSVRIEVALLSTPAEPTTTVATPTEVPSPAVATPTASAEAHVSPTSTPTVATPSDGTEADPACAGWSSQRDACEGVVALVRSYINAIDFDRADSSESYQSYRERIEYVVQNFYTPDRQGEFWAENASLERMGVIFSKIDVTILWIRPTRNEEWSDEVAYVQYETTMEQHAIRGDTKYLVCVTSTAEAVVRKNSATMTEGWRIDELLPYGAVMSDGVCPN